MNRVHPTVFITRRTDSPTLQFGELRPFSDIFSRKRSYHVFKPITDNDKEPSLFWGDKL